MVLYTKKIKTKRASYTITSLLVLKLIYWTPTTPQHHQLEVLAFRYIVCVCVLFEVFEVSLCAPDVLFYLVFVCRYVLRFIFIVFIFTFF